MNAEIYIGVVHKDRDSDYGVSFPEVPTIVTAGSTLEEAAAMAHEALSAHLHWMDDDGELRPEPRGLDWVKALDDAEGAVAFLAVTAPPRPQRQVRINITIDPAVLDRIDRAAAAQGTSRSGFLSAAALAAMKPPGRAAKPRNKQTK